MLVHAVERAKTTGILRFNSRVAVQGCGPIGLICIAVLRTMGIENIMAVDGRGEAAGLCASEMGAAKTVNFKHYKGIEALWRARVKEAIRRAPGRLCVPVHGLARSAREHLQVHPQRRRAVRARASSSTAATPRSTRTSISAPRRSRTVGSWVYTLRDYATTFDFLKARKGDRASDREADHAQVPAGTDQRGFADQP